MESVCTFNVGLRMCIYNISLTRQLSLPLHFVIMWNCSMKRSGISLRDAGYVGYTRGLHERVKGHTRKSSSNTITSNTITVKCLNASLSNFTSSWNVAAKLIASLKKCYIFACVNQQWTCKQIPSMPRCLFRPFIVIYAHLVLFLFCMLFN